MNKIIPVLFAFILVTSVSVAFALPPESPIPPKPPFPAQKPIWSHPNDYSDTYDLKAELNKDRYYPGSTIKITGNGHPLSQVAVTVKNDDTYLKPQLALVKRNHAWNMDYVLPTWIEAGEYEMVIHMNKISLKKTVTVIGPE